MTRESRSNPTVYDDQGENFPPRNHDHLAPQRSDKYAHDTGAYPEDENDEYLDKENQPAGMVIYEDGQQTRRHARQQPLHQQQQHQQHHSQQFSQEHRHPGDTTMTEIRADSGVFEDTKRVGGGGVLDTQDVGSASDQENVQPCPSTPPAAATSAAVLPADIVLDARDELLLREKYLSQRQSNAKAELMERSRGQRQILQRERQPQQQQQQQVPLTRQQSATQRQPIPNQRNAPGAPVRKRTRKSMEAEEFLQQQQREQLLQQQQQQQHQQQAEAQRDASQAQGAERLAQEQARRHRARQAQLQNGGHPTEHAQARDDGQRKRLKGQQQLSQQQQEEEQQLQQLVQQQQLKQQQEERAFQEKYDKMIQAIEYGDIYYDNKYEYRNVTLPKIMLSFIDRRFMEYPDNPYCNVLRILSEEEWRAVGITMSQYWDNWMRHDPEPHVLLFRRPVGTGARMKKEAQRLAKDKHQEKLRLETDASQEAKNGVVPSEQQRQQQHQP